MKLPRVECPNCRRGIAAGPVAGHLSKGRVWRHDPPNQHRAPGDPLVSCDGSLGIVDLPYGQTALTIPGLDDAEAGAEDAQAPVAEPALF
jgi:hypothetical protein